ncbi:leucyl aminopeptidase [Mycoplasmopsis mustelae]|uniref:Probable cytosol aminopeptidase n=1 Tax=Mycoplasmopsis mustelae TaxID=171289 RepID=A0A4R7UEE7_9BACT|nr:M17 family metallopeptidase [Mycoplasmopsis mustelae]TDV24301.1 leucyl aminopeptidase [Mycoplasmopsis mustelae]
MIKVLTERQQQALLLKPAFQGDTFPSYVAQKEFYVTNNLSEKVAYVYLATKDQNLDAIKTWFREFSAKINFDYQIDLEAFAQRFCYKKLLRLFILGAYFVRATLFAKHSNPEQTQLKELSIYMQEVNEDARSVIEQMMLTAKAVTKVRNLQITPENFLNSEQLATEISNDFSGIPGLEVQVLTKKEIQDLNMGLLLSVNRGSTHEPRVVVVKYQGDIHSEEMLSFVGKGITFDTGGVNTKGYHMSGMKYDMSGSVIVAYAVKVLAQMCAKINVSAVMCITDNRLNGDASLPENVYQSMSGKWVEVVDTDAEGRLVLADGLFYAAEKLKATTLVDVATLTGTMLVTLGNIYTGVWSTSDTKWDLFNQAAVRMQEKVWRMPLHEDFNKGNKGSKVADLANWSKTVRSDSNQAALFLREFTKGVDFIHCDVAGTADINGEPQGVLVATLVEFALKLQN